MADVKYKYKARTIQPYGFGNFCLDCLMLLLTAGLWIIWILIREFRKL